MEFMGGKSGEGPGKASSSLCGISYHPHPQSFLMEGIQCQVLSTGERAKVMIHGHHRWLEQCELS
jgi:hypothetical protein